VKYLTLVSCGGHEEGAKFSDASFCQEPAAWHSICLAANPINFELRQNRAICKADTVRNGHALGIGALQLPFNQPPCWS